MLAATGTALLAGCLGAFTVRSDSEEGGFVDGYQDVALLALADLTEDGWTQVSAPEPESTRFERVDGDYVHVLDSAVERYESIATAIGRFGEELDRAREDANPDLLDLADDAFVATPRTNVAVVWFRDRDTLGRVSYTILKSTAAEMRGVDTALAVGYASTMHAKVVTNRPDSA